MCPEQEAEHRRRFSEIAAHEGSTSEQEAKTLESEARRWESEADTAESATAALGAARDVMLGRPKVDDG